jgi:hypothetical protein
VDLRGPFYISLYNVKPVSHDTMFVRGPRQKPMLPMPKTASASGYSTMSKRLKISELRIFKWILKK